MSIASEQKAELYQAIDQLLGCGLVNRHSYFQLKYFVVGKEPTTQSKMWRCIRELQARRESLNSMNLEIEETLDNIDLIDLEIERLIKSKENTKFQEVWEQEFFIREINIQIRKKKRQRDALKTNLQSTQNKQRETEEESNFFLNAFNALQQTEKLKPYDDIQEQTKYWNEKLTQLANLKVLLHLPLDIELVQTILSLSDDCIIKNEVSKLLESERALIENKKE